ncbi:OadG family protein [Porphyromonadaceae bacterium]
MNNINEAFLLLTVGMSTVFVILLFVIYMSRLLILAVNKFSPEVKSEATKSAISPQVSGIGTTGAVSAQKIAAISVALNLATEKKVSILKIEKQ